MEEGTSTQGSREGSSARAREGDGSEGEASVEDVETSCQGARHARKQTLPSEAAAMEREGKAHAPLLCRLAVDGPGLVPEDDRVAREDRCRRARVRGRRRSAVGQSAELGQPWASSLLTICGAGGARDGGGRARAMVSGRGWQDRVWRKLPSRGLTALSCWGWAMVRARERGSVGRERERGREGKEGKGKEEKR